MVTLAFALGKFAIAHKSAVSLRVCTLRRFGRLQEARMFESLPVCVSVFLKPNEAGATFLF